MTPGSASSVSAPLPTLDVSPLIAHAPLLPPPRVPTQPRGRDRARTPAGPHPLAPPLPAHPQGTGLRRNSQACHRHRSPRPRHAHPRPLLRPRQRPRPGTVVAALDPHAALGAAKVGAGRALPRGPGPPAPQGVGGELRASGRRGGGCRRPHGKPCWPMRSTPWESTPATSPRPRTTRMSSGTCGRPSRRHSETASARGTSPKAQPRTHTHPPPPHKRQRTNTGGTHSTPRALRATQHRRRHLTPLPSKPPPRGTTPGPAQKSPNKPDAEGRRRTQQRAPLRPKAPNPGPLPSQPPDRAKTQTQIKPDPHPETANP